MVTETTAPETPCGHGPIATPIQYPWGERIAEGWDGPRNATLYCPACGCGWCGTTADLAQATDSLKEYETDQGYPWTGEYRG